MCYDDNARPPQPPGANGSAHGEEIVLKAADGNRFAAYAARPGNPGGAQILIFPDVRGLHQFYKELALRLAEAGISAVAIDYFGRTAGLSARDESFDFWPHVQQIQLQTFFADVTAALAYLRTGDGANPASPPTFTVGFCMGGTLSFVSGTKDFPLAGVIGFYAGMSRNFGGAGTLLEQAEHIRYPALGLFGGADQGIPVSDVQRFDEELDKAGVAHEIVIYEGAPHSFFDRRYEEFADASANAWQRVLNFISAHTA
ncbi:MAG TPA: dienelactone hydrolase family protein [Ktedonobacteraceae bacterium]|nr:dienelactone hydrolase family protein [Ktedonobacteraceae bacterium]